MYSKYVSQAVKGLYKLPTPTQQDRRDYPSKSLHTILIPLVYLRSRTCAREQREFGNDILDIKDSEPNISTASFTTDDDRHCKIDLSARTGFVAWKDSDQQEQHTSELRIDLHVDTAERQAVFALHGYLLLKNSNTKTNLILFIHPEMIQSIGFARTRPPIPTMQEAHDRGFIALHFTMTQPPSLVAPKGSPLEAKNRYQVVLNDMKSLGTVRQFTVYLNSLNLIPETREQLALLPSVFSSAHPFGLIRTDEKRASLDTLFHSAVGQVIDLGKTAPPSGTSPNQTLAEMAEETAAEPTGVIPPPYPNDGSSRNAPGYSAPIERKRHISESLSPATTAIIRTIKNERSDEWVQPPSTSGALLQSPNQFSTPTDRKRRRTSELLSRSPSDKHILLAIRRVLDRTASLDVRVKQVEKLITECLDAENTCRHDSEEVEQIIGHMNARIDDRIDDQMYDVHRELEGAMLTETEDRVAETVELKHAELRQEIEDEWIDDIRHDISAQLKDQIKKEIFKEMVRALIKVYKGEEDDESPRKKMSRKFRTGSPRTSTASTVTQSTHSTALATASKLRAASETSSAMPGERAFQTAIEDIQKRYGGKFSAEEMMRVLDYLEANPRTVVKYNSCGSELKWLYVQKWAKVKEDA